MSYISLSWLVLLLNIPLWSLSNEVTESKTLILNELNFEAAVNDNDFVLVNFYAPFCGACKGLAPEYEKAAEIMLEKNNAIIIAKVDAIKETKLGEEHGIDGYPTVRYFRKGLTSLDYKGYRRAEDIVSWAIKRSGPPAVQLKTLVEAKELIKNHDVVTIGFFENNSDEAAKTYLTAAELSEYSVFAITFEKSIFKHFNVKTGSIILFNKDYKDEAVFKKELTKREILKFVEIRSLPLIMEYAPDKSLHIFGSHIKLHLFFILSKSDPNTKQQLQNVESVAKDFKEEILFTFFDSDESEFDAVLDYLGIQTGDTLPIIRIIHFDNAIKRYKPNDSIISADNIRSFLRNFFDDKLERVLKSEILSEDWNENPVYQLVGDNFESVVMDPSKDVLVEFYAPWCKVCQNFTSVYDKIGEHYKTYENIIIAKIDAASNEFKNKIISGVPTITLYTKTNEVIDYNGKKTLEAIVKFIESGGTIQEQEDAEQPNEEKSEREDHKDDTDDETLGKEDEIKTSKDIPVKQEL